MSSANDTAERLANEYANEMMLQGQSVSIRDYQGYLSGYRAGVASKELDVFKMLKNQVDISVKLQEENARLKETISYLPKVPTQPYEKDLAQQLRAAEAKAQKLVAVCKEMLRLENVLDLNNAILQDEILWVNCLEEIAKALFAYSTTLDKSKDGEEA